jgi:hypothetical protein
MKIKVTLPVLNYEGKPFQKAKLDTAGEPIRDEKGRPESEPQTLRDIFVNAINHRPRRAKQAAHSRAEHEDFQAHKPHLREDER